MTSYVRLTFLVSDVKGNKEGRKLSLHGRWSVTTESLLTLFRGQSFYEVPQLSLGLGDSLVNLVSSPSKTPSKKSIFNVIQITESRFSRVPWTIFYLHEVARTSNRVFTSRYRWLLPSVRLYSDTLWKIKIQFFYFFFSLLLYFFVFGYNVFLSRLC